MLSDLEISHKADLKPIQEIAASFGIAKVEIEPYGSDIGKINLSILKRIDDRPLGKYVLVTAITPTPLGEGKTVTTIGLSMALNRIGKKAVCTIRQPSMGPTFGIKGGAAGGGYSQVVPMDRFNLHFTGDVHAVSSAHNLLAAFLDNHLYHGNVLDIDPYTIGWPRVIDMSDRPLRQVMVGLGSKSNAPLHESKWDITAASEVMAVLGLSHNLHDLRSRLGRIITAFTQDGKPVTAEMLKAAGAMAVLLKEAIKPNLIQTLENTPALVHTGPFANIAHGNSSILADKIGLRLADFVVTESGFGADIGAEKFFNIKCRQMEKTPDVAVLVCTIRALKMHSGKFKVAAGKPLDVELIKPAPAVVEEGLGNLLKQIENVQLHGIPVVVAINRFDTDSQEELELVKAAALKAGAQAAVESELWARGGVGGEALAWAVIEAASKPSHFQYLY
ncbi:MAG: formate--tetrahydrofolate ligase, partial [Calditrichaeota bacterium]